MTKRSIILTNSDTAGAAGIRSKAKIIISEPDLRDATVKNSLIKYKGNYYYVGKAIAMVTGWYTDKSGKKYYFGKDGKAVTGKREIKGTYYYFNQNGTVTHTGLNYSLSSDCALLT